MKTEAPEVDKLDEQAISEAAAAALRGIELETQVESVCADDDRWCVRFTAEYSQFCDTFRDRFGKENSLEVVREKIKRHILKQQQNKIRSNVRIRRGKPQTRPATDMLLDTALKTVEAIASQTAAVAGEIIGQAVHLPEQALEALATVTEAVAPEEARSSSSSADAEDTSPPLARVAVKAAARKSTRKRSSPARKTTSKKSQGTRKSGSKGKQSAAAESSSRQSKKKSSSRTKRSAKREER